MPRGYEIALGVERFDDLSSLLAIADVVSLHLPLSADTRGIFDATRFASCKAGAIVINTARGALTDVEALFDALASGRIFATGLDVLPEEPSRTPPPRLIAAHAKRQKWLEGRLLLTPHSAWSSVESRRDARQKSAETVILSLAKGELRNCVYANLMSAPQLEKLTPGAALGYPHGPHATLIARRTPDPETIIMPGHFSMESPGRFSGKIDDPRDRSATWLTLTMPRLRLFWIDLKNRVVGRNAAARDPKGHCGIGRRIPRHRISGVAQ